MGGKITFDCGGDATIHLTSQVELSTTTDTTIDGGGHITLDGGGVTRILHFQSANFRATTTVVTLQHLTFTNGQSTGSMLPSAPAPCSQGYDVDAGGAAIWLRDGVLHVIDCTFENNVGPSPGPDVAGGGIYVVGSLDLTVVGSTFRNNRASNGGAIGSLFSNSTFYDNVFDGNQATGNGGNTIDNAHCSVGVGEVGNGGSGGAIVMDGGEDFSVVSCGNRFTNNHANVLGGAMFRTPDIDVADITFDRCTFDSNVADAGGGALYIHHSRLHVMASTFSNNSSPGPGAIQSDDTSLDFVNSTFAGNRATNGLGGAIALWSGQGGTIRNCTFANNGANGGSGLFAAAIAGNPTLTIDNTIFANNTSMDCGAPMACQDMGSGSNDLQWPQNHVVCANPDHPCVDGITFADAMLGTLGDHGGPTQTLATTAPDSLVQIGTNCPATDQSGRPRRTPCTIGALEKE
jgi:parallel beta-helix repeat protein